MSATTQGERTPTLLRFIISVGASTLFATLLTSLLTVYQINLARADNSASIKRDALVKLQDGLVELVNAQKKIYLITLHNYQDTGEWRSHRDIEAEERRASADTQVDALLVRVNDQSLTRRVKALQKNVFDMSNTVVREDAEKISGSLESNFSKAQQRIGELLSGLDKLPLSERVLNQIRGKDGAT